MGLFPQLTGRESPSTTIYICGIMSTVELLAVKHGHVGDVHHPQLVLLPIFRIFAPLFVFVLTRIGIRLWAKGW